MESINQHLNEIRSVLTEEIGALSRMPRESILSNGKHIATRGDAAVWMNAYIVFLNRMEKYLDTIINQIRT